MKNIQLMGSLVLLGAISSASAFSATSMPLGLRHCCNPGKGIEYRDPLFLHVSAGRGRSPVRRNSVSIFMEDGKGIAGWIQKALRENMGNAPPPEPKKPGPRAKIDLRPLEPQQEDEAVKPDYNFKFSSKAKELLEVDTSSVTDKAVKAKKKLASPSASPEEDIDAGIDRRFYEVSIDRPTGIEFATDLSLKYVYIMEIKENSAADLSPVPIDVGNQLVAINGEDCIGKRFADVANFLGKDPSKPLNFRFFRGSKQELLSAIGKEDYVATSSRITAIMPGDSSEEKVVEAAAGVNMRDALISDGVQVYRIQSGRFTNCNGKQLCGTCIVDVKEGAEFTNSKSVDEANFLRKMPDSYRLSCCVNVYGDVKVKTLPPTGKKFIEFS